MNIPGFIPPLLIVAAIAWFAAFEWLRHRSHKKHIHTGFAPGTQGLAWAGILGALLLVVAGAVLMIVGKTA